MISWLLARLFPPQFPRIPEWEADRVFTPETDALVCFQEQGACNPPQPKQYRNGIERHFAEEPRQ